MKKLLSFFMFSFSALALAVPSSVFAAPIIESFDPEDGETISVSSIEFFIGFDQEVTVGTGFITLHKTSDDSTVVSWDVEEDINLDESEVDFDLGVTLEYSTEYYITIDAGAFIGADEEDFVGISDPTIWNLTTRAPIGEPEFDFERLSMTPEDGEMSGVTLGRSAVSSDGRYVVFIDSTSHDLFLRDTQANTTTLITTDADSSSGSKIDISSDGNFVAFGTSVDFAPGDSNIAPDLYVYDIAQESFELASVNDGGAGGFSEIFNVAFSSDGRYVAFATNARLLPDVADGNNLYIRDRELATTTLVLHGADGTNLALSADGRYVVFNTYEALDGIDVNGDLDVYVYDTVEESFELISVNEGESAAAGQSFFLADISSSGRYVIFTSRATDIIDGVGNGSDDALFLRDRQENTTTHIVGGYVGGNIGSAALSGDERYIVYAVSAVDVIDLYRYNLEEETTLFITEGADDGQVESIQSLYPAVSEEGSMIVFASNAVNLVEDDTNGTYDIFLWDENAQVEDEETPPAEEEEEEDSGRGSSSHRRSGGGGSGTTTTGGNSGLLDTLRSLIQQFIAQGGTPSSAMLSFLGTSGSASSDFTRDLDLGSEGPDVMKLQEFLVSHSNGPAALALKNNGLTNYFGPLTQAALAEYQASVGITPAVGYFGPITRAYINGL